MEHTASEDAPDFKKNYTPLDREISEIRLFTFKKGSGHVLRGRLHVYPISACPQYTAISYTWGDPYPQHVIEMDGTLFPIRDNLYHALQAISELERPALHYFWIDSICINQADVLERNHQVGQMKTIFSNANPVIAWLGQEGVGFDVSTLPHPLPAILPPGLKEQQKELFGLLEGLNYWRRLWIVQELILAKDILIGLGGQFFSWKYLERLALRFSVIMSMLTLELRPPDNIDAEDIAPEWVRLVRERKKHISSLREEGRLGSLILQFGRNACTEPRDMVIGLLGLVADDAAHLADYSMSIEDFFRAVCKYVFATSEFENEAARMQFQCFLGGNLGISSNIFREWIDE
jgi:hypothetical protein